MGNEKHCGWVAAHVAHRWESQGYGPFGHRAYYWCPGNPESPISETEGGAS